jgi:hypothetical protein
MRFTGSIMGALAGAGMSMTFAAAGWAAETADAANQRLLQGRAAEAVIWGLPAVNTLLMYDEMIKAGGKPGEVIYWGKPLDWHNQTLTPNPDTLYFMGFYDPKAQGPTVIEIPPADDDGSLNGNFVTLWQEPMEDAGLLGVDKGAGVKFLVTPPNFTGTVPAGFEQLKSDSNLNYFLVRSNLRSHSDADVQKSIEYGKKVKFYPLSQIENPPETVFRDVKDVDFDSTIKYDLSFFTLLNRIIQDEPWLERDRVMIDMLRSVGIEKGKPFTPDAATKAALTAGMNDAHAWLAARYDAGLPTFFDGTHWTPPTFPELVKAASEGFTDVNSYPVDVRGLTYTYGYIGIKRLGAGQFYLINIKDKAGKSYDGGKTYKLHVPPNVPVQQYWSITVYDRETHALVKGMDRASRASNAADLQRNEDGSVDIYFGPKAPAGKESNWVPTDPKREFELMFRLYGPTQDLFDKKWTLPDVERI